MRRAETLAIVLKAGESFLEDLKQGQSFVHKQGKYEVIWKNHPMGIKCKLIAGTMHFNRKGLKLSDLQMQKLKKSLSENHLILPRKTVVRIKFDKKNERNYLN